MFLTQQNSLFAKALCLRYQLSQLITLILTWSETRSLLCENPAERKAGELGQVEEWFLHVTGRLVQFDRCQRRAHYFYFSIFSESFYFPILLDQSAFQSALLISEASESPSLTSWPPFYHQPCYSSPTPLQPVIRAKAAAVPSAQLLLCLFSLIN